MTSRARTLDVIITGITPTRVYYGFPVGEEKIYHADMYAEGQFDLSTIQVGKRYLVHTADMLCKITSGKTGRVHYEPKYVWVKATEVQPRATLQTHTAKQRKVKAWLATTKLADDGTLFNW
jgi:hypothetical protein